mmetsp:Transcript_281/g.859  ORF Transcript_281/g.859 Transcript_281/m.859 type:complete len:248 (+) Transcript_281:449-1192(+)
MESGTVSRPGGTAEGHRLKPEERAVLSELVLGGGLPLETPVEEELGGLLPQALLRVRLIRGLLLRGHLPLPPAVGALVDELLAAGDAVAHVKGEVHEAAHELLRVVLHVGEGGLVGHRGGLLGRHRDAHVLCHARHLPREVRLEVRVVHHEDVLQAPIGPPGGHVVVVGPEAHGLRVPFLERDPAEGVVRRLRGGHGHAWPEPPLHSVEDVPELGHAGPVVVPRVAHVPRVPNDHHVPRSAPEVVPV